jgi:hypothetical protein
MKRRPVYLISFTIIISIAVSILLLIFSAENVFAWGFWAHKRINRIAVFTLPKEMFGFYKNNIEYITESAVNADKRRYTDKNEAPRHYIDLDNYGNYPYDSIPRKWKEAVAKFSEDSLKKHGIVPWHIGFMYFRLVEAFKKEDKEQILRLSADIGHYIADAFVPLHTTSNYNGQKTGQTGLHAFWESRVPELVGEEYNYFVGKANYIEIPLTLAWEAVISSNQAVDSVLQFEKELSQRFPEDRKYAFVNKGNKTVRTYSEEYSKAYSEMLNGQVERRMRESVIAIGSIWFSAWVDAGQPNLEKFIDRKFTQEEQAEIDSGKVENKNEYMLGRPEE